MEARIHPRKRPALTPPAFSRKFAAFLFDMDGTLIDSSAATLRCWGAWADRHGLDKDEFLPTIHGVKGVDTISRLGIPGLDPVAEAASILVAEMEDLDGIVAISGVVEFLNSLPSDNWAIVTSAPAELAKLRLAAAGVRAPDVIVTGEDVAVGKPHPQCFLLGAQRLGVNIEDCVVFEDAHAGIRAGESAGAALVVITATHMHPMETTHATTHNYAVLSAVTHEDGWLSILKEA
jgi:mannitol-1-/sugar-/sorbitol-6-phosphatase